MNEDLFIIRLRDCFTAGYTFPQFCIDNNIKKPLFVALDERRVDFLWEIFVQFKYDKRITPRFTLLNGKISSICFAFPNILRDLNFENPATINLNDFDRIIFLTNIKSEDKLPKEVYLEELTNYFIIRTYADIPLINFTNNFPEIKLITMTFPPPPPSYDSEFAKLIFERHKLMEKIRLSKGKHIPNTFDKLGYNNNEVYRLISTPQVKTHLDGSTEMEDNEDNLVGIKNGKRKTAYQPYDYDNKIYFVGGCHVYGINAPFDKNIPSYLQKMLNENGLPYRVENESQFFAGRHQDIFYTLMNLKPDPGDIVIVEISNIMSSQFPCVNINDAFKNYDYRKIWGTLGHSNEIGYKILAKHFFQFLTQNNFFKDVKFNYSTPPPPPARRYGIPKENFLPSTKLFNVAELEAHKKKLRELRLKVGCIVMNANPFTRGHEYLVEYAVSRVQKLFVMVVSEDKSEFSFADRFELVKRGTKQFPNVEVIPSEKFVISQQTFSGYFNKENLQDVTIDSTDDVKIFAEEIAPSLGVNVRFVGEEPEDTVTRRYNETMKNFLPLYNINFCEIPRREIDGEIISAKTVRAALKAGDFDKIKKLVPATTYEFLREKYFK